MDAPERLTIGTLASLTTGETTESVEYVRADLVPVLLPATPDPAWVAAAAERVCDEDIRLHGSSYEHDVRTAYGVLREFLTSRAEGDSDA